jgi:hypothetical protein
MNSVIFDLEAQSELFAAIGYYKDCQHGLGRRFRLLVDSAVQKIVEVPFIYRILKSPFRRYLLPKFPYSIIYSIEADHIRIINIAHYKCKPGYWLNRVQDMDKDS